jgi:hypothetical protein
MQSVPNREGWVMSAIWVVFSWGFCISSYKILVFYCVTCTFAACFTGIPKINRLMRLIKELIFDTYMITGCINTFETFNRTPRVEPKRKIAKRKLLKVCRPLIRLSLPISDDHTRCQRLRLVKPFHPMQMELRSELQSYHKIEKPHLRKGSGGGTRRGNLSPLVLGSWRPWHHLHHHLHHH